MYEDKITHKKTGNTAGRFPGINHEGEYTRVPAINTSLPAQFYLALHLSSHTNASLSSLLSPISFIHYLAANVHAVFLIVNINVYQKI